MNIIYIRKSTNHQSYNRQLELLKNIEYEKRFIETDSGKNDERLEFNKMLDYIKKYHKKNPDEEIVVIAESLSRLSRKLSTVIETIELINNNGAVLKTLKENFDFRNNSATSKLLIAMIAAINQFEVDQLRERVAEGMKSTKKKIGRPSTPSMKTKRALEIYKNNTSNLSNIEIARLVGISERTMYRIIKKENEHG